MNQKSFQNWLYRELDSRNWSQRKLAHEANVSPGAISHVLTGNREPGPELCSAIARALNYPPEFVFKAAGILPPDKDANPTLEEANQLLDELPGEYQKQALQLIRFLHDTHVPYNAKKAKSSSN